MTRDQQEKEQPSGRTTLLRLLLVCGAGLGLGALGNALGWNQLANPWPYLGLLCPLLLGVVVALIAGVRTRPVWSGMLGASVLAWIGFYLVFLFIAFHIHPYNPPEPSLPQNDQNCSPCFDAALGTGLLMLAFFPIGLLMVGLMAVATRGAFRFLSHRRLVRSQRQPL
jgi:hypothetical protein